MHADTRMYIIYMYTLYCSVCAIAITISSSASTVVFTAVKVHNDRARPESESPIYIHTVPSLLNHTLYTRAQAGVRDGACAFVLIGITTLVISHMLSDIWNESGSRSLLIFFLLFYIRISLTFYIIISSFWRRVCVSTDAKFRARAWVIRASARCRAICVCVHLAHEINMRDRRWN